MNKLGPYELNRIYVGDARILAKEIPDESVDLIFTDPVYQNIDDYRWLAKEARRVLKFGGIALVWQGTIHEQAGKDALSEYLTYNLTFNYIVVGNNAFLNSLKVFAWRCPCFWMSKGKTRLPLHWIPDTVISTKKTANEFKWNKNPEALMTWIQAFPSTVVDFFTGGGTIPVVCKILGYDWLAFEIDPETAEKARRRVAQTQPPLFVSQPEQVEMAL